ncbi:MAG TPA: transporter substrate-binding domain-containing protein [Bacteroidales bacterium]|nr:transporter substrate-binding domain-containing protein [Bacteroidales bacterium]
MTKKITIFLILIFSFLCDILSAEFTQADTIFFKGNYDYPPYQLLDDNNVPIGFSVDLLKSIGKTMGFHVKIELAPWNQVRAELEAGKIDGLVAMSYSEEREHNVNFSTPYIYITHAVFVRNESEIISFDNIKNKKVIVVKGDIMHDYLISNNITSLIIPVRNYQTALRLLSAGEYDCALINKVQGQFAINEYNLKNLKFVGSSVHPQELCFAIKKDNPQLLQQINEGLKIVKATGEFDRIYEKWFSAFDEKNLKSEVLKTIIWILIPFLIILGVILIWSASLKKQVALKTNELQKELSERKKAELQLIHEKSLMNSMINSIPDLIFYKNKKNIYIGCNDAFCKFNNKTKDEIIGKQDFEIFSEHQAGFFYSTDQKIIESNEPVRIESWEKNAKGELLLLDTVKIPFVDDDGNTLGIVGICRDITERHKSEIELKEAKEKAEESDRLKSAFLANMSHEIRTPMNAIVGFSDLLVDTDTSSDDREELVKHINNNCNTLLYLIDDIIDLAKIEASEFSVVKKDMNVNKLMKELDITYSEFRRKINKDHLEIKWDKTHYKNNFILSTDLFRLKQIMTNLLDNAFKYTDQGFVRFGYEILKEEKLVKFYVTDTGIGIPQDKQNQIFERFNKLESSKSKIYRGTGLGLTITKNIVKKLGGNIRLNSEVNKGSTFYFTLPLDINNQPVEKKTKEIIQNQQYHWEGKTILIVEDEISNYKYLEMLLKNKGLNILHTTDGKETIEICKKRKAIDLILIDIKMPVLNGIEATKIIRTFNTDIPIIAQTAFAMPEDKELILKSGCNDYLAKPIKTNELMKLLHQYLK